MDDAGKVLEEVVARLRRCPTISIDRLEPGRPLGEELELLELGGRAPPPPVMLDFYRSLNGVTLLWSGTVEGQPARGDLNILPLLVAFLRGGAREGDEPLEGVLWNEEFEPEALEQMKRMAIFESIAGRSAFITFLPDTDPPPLFLVEDETNRPIVPDFETTVGLLLRYAGAEGLRDHLTAKDWKARIEGDAKLARIIAL